MTNKQKATDFLSKCRVISSFDQPEGYFVETNTNCDIFIKRGFKENGQYQEEELESFGLLEIMEEEPCGTVLNLKEAIRDNIGRKRFFIEEALYETMKELVDRGYPSERDIFEDEAEDDLDLENINNDDFDEVDY